MQLSNPQEIEAKVAVRYQTFLILWAAIFMSITIFLVLVFAIPSKGAPNPVLSYSLLLVDLSVVAGSLLLKRKMTQQAIDKGSAESLQSAHILSLALCESTALLGLFDHFVTGSKTSWLAFAIAAIGMLLHFPKKDHVRAVTHKTV